MRAIVIINHQTVKMETPHCRCKMDMSSSFSQPRNCPVTLGPYAFFLNPIGLLSPLASLTGPYPADACGLPSAPCGVGAGPTSWPGRVIFFPTLVPGSGRFQLTNLLGYSYVLRFGLWLGFALGL